MKIFLKYITIVLTALLLGSCNITDVDPYSDANQEAAFENENAIRSTVVGCYDVLQSSSYYGRNLIVIPDLLSYNLKSNGTTMEWAEFENNVVQPGNAMIDGIWSRIYDGINRTNMVFANIDKAGLSEEKREYYLGHCYFLRALHYFNLVRLFGDVPLKLEPTTEVGVHLNVPRTASSLIYDQIETDLEKAIERLELLNISLMENQQGQATAYTARALMSKVKLYQQDWVGAESYSGEAILGYSLEESYVDLFPAEFSTESILEIKYNSTDNNTIAQFFMPGAVGGRLECAPTDTIITVLTNDSIRLASSIADDDNGIYVNKYSEIETRSDNIYVMRAAELYLIRAEAMARNNGSITSIQADINMVRNRAGLDDTEADTYEELLLEIESERHKEFAFEGERWFDLVRTGRAIDLIANVTNTDQYLMPIPLSEMQTNTAMTQNDGY
jgi:hypothetical protein